MQLEGFAAEGERKNLLRRVLHNEAFLSF